MIDYARDPIDKTIWLWIKDADNQGDYYRRVGNLVQYETVLQVNEHDDNEQAAVENIDCIINTKGVAPQHNGEKGAGENLYQQGAEGYPCPAVPATTPQPEVTKYRYQVYG